ncbi:hypothetical protein [Metapseudomonas resinovorans]|uniref:Uncharacterized protein n=1 Tax=Metapseudomonas resinovorans NBRC 106553 TaxID=1245471 RepID=S6AM65_METRE|nr:hypothetical protein [Pseudomonas resinovorans]BAN49930.1 hypothetical protein PCA10_41980 [Pseudomonas resinovorans NBRC 106553]
MIRPCCRTLLKKGVLGLSALGLMAGLVAFNFQSTTELEGRYGSSGQVILSSGSTLQVSHTILFKDGRFYAMTRQGSTILETSGAIDSGFLGHFRLQVEEGDVSGLWPGEGMDNDLVFNLLYSRKRGSVINLERLGACLYTVETRQVYCPTPQSG